MNSHILNVWLHGEHLGELQRLRNGANRLRFDADALRRWGTGTRLLSYSLPLTSKRVESASLDAWLDNLLPEGPVRAQLEQQHGVRPSDAFGLLAHIGAECAGAIQFTHQDDPPTGRLVPLDEAEVNRIVTDLPTLSPPEGESISASLGGVQSKILLTRTPDGWAWPAAGAMSTHIVKPEPTDPSVPIPRIVEYEHWAMRVARAAGVPAARTDLVWFGDRLAIVVERYDRQDGRRLHQEDFAQALGVRAGAKYEPSTEPVGRLRRIAVGPGGEALVPTAFWELLLRLVAFNFLIGNGDAHAKNYSMILTEGVFALAPVYDVAPVFHINNRFSNFGMRVNGARDLRYLAPDDLVAEATTWGLSERAARDILDESAQATLAALDAVPGGPLTDPVREAAAQRIRSAGLR